MTKHTNDELATLFYLLGTLTRTARNLSPTAKTEFSNALRREADHASPDHAKRLRAIANTVAEHTHNLVVR